MGDEEEGLDDALGLFEIDDEGGVGVFFYRTLLDAGAARELFVRRAGAISQLGGNGGGGFFFLIEAEDGGIAVRGYLVSAGRTGGRIGRGRIIPRLNCHPRGICNPG